MENGNHNIGLMEPIVKTLTLIYFIQVWRSYEQKMYCSCEMQA